MTWLPLITYQPYVARRRREVSKVHSRQAPEQTPTRSVRDVDLQQPGRDIHRGEVRCVRSYGRLARVSLSVGLMRAMTGTPSTSSASSSRQLVS